MQKKTKIIATIGPASNSPNVLRELDAAGATCARINTAHGDFEQYKDIIDNVREHTDMAVMLDIKGPEIRVRLDEAVQLTAGEPFRVNFEEQTPKFSHNFYDDISVGQEIYFDGGSIRSVVTEKHIEEEPYAVLKPDVDAELKPNKGVNVPNVSADVPNLSEKDIQGIAFAKKHSLEYIALSFVRNADDVKNLQNRLGDAEIKIISKIENHEGVEAINEILEVSDGIMVARGDLGIELPQQRIPIIQKRIISRCINHGKIGVVATQMLESMTEEPIPTRAEVSDVANALLDGADCVMLSGETAIGKYPVQAVETMTAVAQEVEHDIPLRVDLERGGTISEEMSKAAYTMAKRNSVSAIIALGNTATPARLLSRFRLDKPIYAVTSDDMLYHQLKLYWGVVPVHRDEIPQQFIIPTIAEHLVETKNVTTSDTAVFFAGVGTADPAETNLLEIHDIGNFLNYHGL